ncbi:hypothetical protein V6N11_054754 [Hibiscus sabdariffa]|uniref:Uncharacterized protein n=1 Tax=Hibiscus sabdariffa TaxID=183260 RepID=A0ABR2S4Y8_9ROSI
MIIRLSFFSLPFANISSNHSDVDSEPELAPPPLPPDRTAPARATRAHRPDPPRPARANRGGRPPRH